ncbi:MAG: hypothetical protein N4A53_08285 [Pelagimonas sp.]|jgi:hypothetical protein|nr:hypothetical protein [Pelagimonas sp.]
MGYRNKHRLIEIFRDPVTGGAVVMIGGGADVFNQNLLAQHGFRFDDKASWKTFWRMTRAIAAAVIMQEFVEVWE